MEFKKYQHLEKLGRVETNGITDGMCYIFPKIYGTNSQLWYDNGLKAGSRNRELSLDNDNANFYHWAIQQTNILEFFEKHNVRLYGEWLVPHTLKTYEDSAWVNFYVFDVMVDDEYLPYETYKEMLDEFNILYIIPMCKINNPTHERLYSLLDQNTYLIKDGLGSGEGIVIKNYSYKNKFGNIVWAKIVKNEFKAKHSKCELTEIKEKQLVEEKIVNKYVTETLIEKEYQKIVIECEGWSSKYIPRLFAVVYYCLIKEESWNFIKENKNPTINFTTLNWLTQKKIKELKKDIF